MKLTNNLNLPDLFVRAVENDTYDAGDSDYTATQLIRPPQAVFLEKQHEDEIVVDVESMAMALFGTAMHLLLERAATEDDIVEERFFASYDGARVSAQIDMIQVDDGVYVYESH